MFLIIISESWKYSRAYVWKCYTCIILHVTDVQCMWYWGTVTCMGSFSQRFVYMYIHTRQINIKILPQYINTYDSVCTCTRPPTTYYVHLTCNIQCTIHVQCYIVSHYT